MNALVMSRNTSAVKLLVSAFAELGMEYRISFSPSETVELVAAGQHSAVVVDFDVPHAVQVARTVHMMPGKQRPVLFGMIGSGTSIAGVFQAGGNFVLYKPLDLLQVLHSLRAAQGFMRKDRRGTSRQKRETLAYLQLPNGTVPALVQDLTEQGLSVQAAEPLMPLRGVPLRFLLPETTEVIKATGDFIWADKVGRAGLFFTDIPIACRRDLQVWLRKHHARKEDAVRTLLEPKKRRAATAAH
jgi:DNA-binding response OmpR family regulator